MSERAREYLRWALRDLRALGWTWHDLRKVIDEIIDEGGEATTPPDGGT